MARPLRLEYPGALWHVMNRGVERRDIYHDDFDRRSFVKLLSRTIQRYKWRLHAFVLMSNHYHLLFETPLTNLSHGMKELDGDYASSFNLRHNRSGHLFTGRFKSHLVDSDAYLLEVSRYVVLNPVRAGIVTAAADWRWGSYRATAGLDPAPGWLDTAAILKRLHPTATRAAQQRYREFVAAAIGETRSPWDDLVAQAFLGGSAFLERVESLVQSQDCSVEHPLEQRHYSAVSVDIIEAAVAAEMNGRPHAGGMRRIAVIMLARSHTSATNAELGRRLGISGQRVGQLFTSGRSAMESNATLASIVAGATRRLSDR